MGEHQVNTDKNANNRSEFIKHLLQDIRALQRMLDENLIEDDIIRIGAEQEICLVTPDWRPANNSSEILSEINDPHFTTELARYNLEINLDPIELKGDCFSLMHDQLSTLLAKGQAVAEKHNTKIVLTGILPTISENELASEYITPSPRYYALNDQLTALRGSDFQLHIRGTDELSILHDSVLFEACNTSFQLHLQIAPDDFISSYNWSQAIAAPILAVSTNSPLLLGRELWCETRIALFRQSTDTRKFTNSLKDKEPRVSFGTKWASGNAVSIFKDSIAQYKVILEKDIEKGSLELLDAGISPKLTALNLHSGTIYPWNRACYGVGNGKAHLRIENRYIASGPSTLDELATFAFWVGLMVGRPEKYDDMPSVMDFRDAKSNFIKAARIGKDSILEWNGKRKSVKKLVIKELLPIARNGLEKVGIDQKDIELLLNVIQKRTKGQTGSQWISKNFNNLKKQMKKDEALRLITKGMYLNQQKNTSVANWPNISKNHKLKDSSFLLGHIMTTRLFTVHENDLASLATEIMKWKDIHHIPVVNSSGRLRGLLTWSHGKVFQEENEQGSPLKVSDIMEENLITEIPSTHIQDATKTMKKHNIGCLPIMSGNDLVGIITVKDLIAFENA